MPLWKCICRCQISFRKTGKLWEEWEKHCPMQNKVSVILLQPHVRWCKAGVEEGRGRSGGVVRQRWATWSGGEGSSRKPGSRTVRASAAGRCFPSSRAHPCSVQAKVGTRTSTASLARHRNWAGKRPEAQRRWAQQAVCYPWREAFF